MLAGYFNDAFAYVFYCSFAYLSYLMTYVLVSLLGIYSPLY